MQWTLVVISAPAQRIFGDVLQLAHPPASSVASKKGGRDIPESGNRPRGELRVAQGSSATGCYVLHCHNVFLPEPKQPRLGKEGHGINQTFSHSQWLAGTGHVCVYSNDPKASAYLGPVAILPSGKYRTRLLLSMYIPQASLVPRPWVAR